MEQGKDGVFISIPDRVATFVLLVIVAVNLAARLPELCTRLFDPDEFEHLHAAYCIRLGMVPYRDFFEHHTPLFWIFLQPFFSLLDRPELLLFAARGFMFLGMLGILVATHRLAGMLCTRPIGLVSVVFLSCTTMFVTKSMEIRPDIPSVLFWLIALYFAVGPSFGSAGEIVSKRESIRAKNSPPRLVSFTQKSVGRSRSSGGTAEGWEAPAPSRWTGRDACPTHRLCRFWVKLRKLGEIRRGLKIKERSTPPEPSPILGTAGFEGFETVSGDSHFRGGKARFFWAGVFAGLSALCSQKVLLGLSGLTAGICLTASGVSGEHPRQRAVKEIALFATGFFIPFIPVVIAFFVTDGLGAFVYRCFIFNALWRVRTGPVPICLEFLRQNPIIFSLGLTGLLMLLGSAGWSRERWIFLCAAIGTLAGIGVIPVLRRQYLLLIFPLWSILAAEWLTNRVMSSGHCRETTWDYIFAAVLAASLAFSTKWTDSELREFVITWIAVLALVLTWLGSKRFSRSLLWALGVALLVFFWSGLGQFRWLFWAGVVVYLLTMFLVAQRERVLITILAGIAILPLSRSLERDYIGSAAQLEHIRIVMEETGPGEAVFDGWSGYGVFRPHAYYYFFLHEEIRAMLSEQERKDEVIEMLRSVKPRMIIYDENLRSLGDEVGEYIAENYRPLGVGNLYRRIDGTPAGADFQPCHG